MEHNRYIGPTAKFKEFFAFSHQKLPASQAKLIPYPLYTEISGTAGFDSHAAWRKEVSQDGHEHAQLRKSVLANHPSSPAVYQ